MDIVKELFKLQDVGYKEFNQKLIPTVEKDRVIGIRMPVLRNFAKEIYKNNFDDCIKFLEKLPHFYFEENNLHAMIIENMKDFKKVMEYTEKLIPYIDNWATCDTFSPKIFKKHSKEVYEKILNWINSENTYVIRYGIGLLLSNYLDENFEKVHLEIVSKIRSEEYYVNMMVAWYFATALSKQYESTIEFIENHTLDIWTHNKAIQKSVESRRITDEQKIYLRSLKIKG